MKALTLPVTPASQLTGSSVLCRPRLVDRVADEGLACEALGRPKERQLNLAGMWFTEYVDHVDEAMMALWNIDSFDAQMDPDVLSQALDDGITPLEIALRWGYENGRHAP
ncbi:hypothetical protein [Azospirillum sp. SYSU D00513]|uniref:hypothetical protein n=1 Tax=Azospirillum sp. SYSU D00513 TaxID=2812561 RepID=UPI001A975A39|nr:hypothetical protein [Azospirillum sp. SYSU D00513]